MEQWNSRTAWFVACVALGAVGCAEMGAPVSRAGEVIACEGDGVGEGAECRAEIVNEGRGRYLCRVEVECDGRTLYGGPMLGGYTHCEASEGRWTRVWDHGLSHEDGDPYVEWDVSTGALEVRTRAGSTRVRIGG